MPVFSDFGDFLLRLARRRGANVTRLADMAGLTRMGFKHYLQARSPHGSETARFFTYLCVWIDGLDLNQDEAAKLWELAYLSRVEAPARKWISEVVEQRYLLEMIAAGSDQRVADLAQRLEDCESRTLK